MLEEKPESAHLSASSASLKPGLAISVGLNNTHGESTVTVVTPITPMAGLGNGSTTSAAITPAKIAK